ncbi:type I restriction-modification system, restriction subunit R [Helicobacter fennelliae]|uniref:Type I restriction-modification system, restriction subunit R n=2 Tax=Helicobacter fennelliae TaxID=215 RepID=T1DVN2_9HELI|nr:type I restriction-modification system, restriction subunit R [Helicobacter fennelliae]GAD18702.1 type I restriction-modification system, restriction subunit R [Helicobacter fennelliae MRY12-0050]SQB97373.1 type I restriction-modification system restriction enzyme [Helicobacter fennelliae]STP07125.1 type I restriction-modification system restriction enzyme [Helicobacter fennelliae]STQ83327.1 type I restriction-modification system restriction enzyme [Helicobacter fennelliae]
MLLKSFREYLEGYIDESGKEHKGYKELIHELKSNFKEPQNLQTIEEKKAFIKLFNEILKLNNVLSTFDEFEELEKEEELLTLCQKQDLQSAYLRICDEIKQTKEQEKTNINDDIVFEIELIKQVDINIDYILTLIAQNLHKDTTKELENIDKILDSSLKLRSKKDLIHAFISTFTPNSDNNSDTIQEQFTHFIATQKEKDLTQLIQQFNLNEKESKIFADNSFKNGYVEELGEDIEKTLPNDFGFFGEAGERRKEQKAKILQAFREFYEKYSL